MKALFFVLVLTFSISISQAQLKTAISVVVKVDTAQMDADLTNLVLTFGDSLQVVNGNYNPDPHFLVPPQLGTNCFDPKKISVWHNFVKSNLFLGDSATGREFIHGFGPSGYPEFNIIISDTAQGNHWTRQSYNVWIDFDHWWIDKYLNENEIDHLITSWGVLLEVDNLVLLDEYKDVMREGIIINMQNTVRKGVKRAKTAIYSGNSDTIYLMESWDQWP